MFLGSSTHIYVSVCLSIYTQIAYPLDWIDIIFTKNHWRIIFICDVLMWISLNRIYPYHAAHWVIFSNWILRHYHNLRLQFQKNELEVIQKKKLLKDVISVL